MCIIGDGDPRTCEEQNRWGNVYPRSGGLSPQLRGTGSGSKRPGGRVRFIPAHAGNRCGVSVRISWWSVYPRTCGEQTKYIALI